MNSWDRMPEALKDQVLKRFACMAEVAKLSESDRIAYDRMVNTYWVNQTVEADIRAESIAKGLAKGQIQEKRANAQKMKAKGYTVEDIVDITGLSVEEVEGL